MSALSSTLPDHFLAWSVMKNTVNFIFLRSRTSHKWGLPSCYYRLQEINVRRWVSYGSTTFRLWFVESVNWLKGWNIETHAQLGDLSFWKESRVKSVHLFIQLTGNSAFASCHFIGWSYCTDSRLVSVSTLTAKTHSRKQTQFGVTGSSESVIVNITFLVNWIARLPVPMPDVWILQHGCWRT